MSAVNQKNKALVWDFWQRMNFAEPDQVAGLDEVAAVRDQVPIPSETPQTVHRREVDQPIAEDLVRRSGAVDHFPLGIVTGDRCAAESFQDADLNLLRL